MQINNRKRAIYDIEVMGSYEVGQASQLAEALSGLRDTLTGVLSHGDQMNIEELEVTSKELAALQEMLSGFYGMYLETSRVPSVPSLPTETTEEEDKLQPADHPTNPLNAGSEEQEEEDPNTIPDQDNQTDASDAEWQSIEGELKPPYLHGPSNNPSVEEDLVAGLTSSLLASRQQDSSKRAIRQIHTVEAHLLLMHLLGIEYVDPKNDLTGFSRLVNDVHALRILSRPSVHFLREPIRGYRTAEQNGKIVMGIKVPNELEPNRVTDYFGFIAERGMAYALRELKEVGVLDMPSLQNLASVLEQQHPHEIEQLRRASRRVAETVAVLPS